jgi:hypothetical protein
MSANLPSDSRSDEPVTLYRVMQATIGQGLRERCEVSREVPHELLVLLMQINDRDRRRQNKRGFIPRA